MIQNILDIVTIVIMLAPIGVQIFKLVAAKTHNTRLKNLSDRAEIIVTALDQSSLGNKERKSVAAAKLEAYAKEVGIKVNADQIDDYIESAVNVIRNLTN